MFPVVENALYDGQRTTIHAMLFVCKQRVLQVRHMQRSVVGIGPRKVECPVKIMQRNMELGNQTRGAHRFSRGRQFADGSLAHPSHATPCLTLFIVVK